MHLDETSKYSDPNYTKGWIAIYSSATNDTIIKIEVDRLNGFVDEGQAHGTDVPKQYAGQNDVFYEDVNFDGRKDFILKNWSHRSDSWKQYRVYLAQADGGFTYSSEFSELTNGERGMFVVDSQNHTLTVSHDEYYKDYKKVYKVINRELKPFSVYAESYANRENPFFHILKGRVQNPKDKLDTHYTYYLNPKDKRVHKTLTFPVKKNGKRVLLFGFKKRLMYALIQKDGAIEFNYGLDDENFAYAQTASGKSLSFQKGVYSIYETPKTIGIKIHIKGKTYDWQGNKQKQKGNLNLLLKGNYKNVGRLFRVQGFSNRYYAKVFLKNPDAVFSAGWVAVYDKQNDSELIRVTSDELAVNLKEDKMKANVQQLPYGEQSVVIYEDFNFDGKKDLAIEDGQHSCYHGPSYQIYLAKPDDRGFKKSKAFTELAQNYCGLFEVNTKTKTLHTMTKSGCCWHQYATFKVENNQPKLIKKVEIDHRGGGGMLSQSKKVTTYANGKKTVETERKLNMRNMQVTENTIYELDFPSGKKMYLIVYNPDTLTYAYVNQKGNIELLYSGNFVYNTKEKSMSFTRKGVTYTIQGNQLIVKTPKGIYKHTGKQVSDFKELHEAIEWGVKNVSTVQ